MLVVNRLTVTFFHNMCTKKRHESSYSQKNKQLHKQKFRKKNEVEKNPRRKANQTFQKKYNTFQKSQFNKKSELTKKKVNTKFE